jgi:hypothetical protein
MCFGSESFRSSGGRTITSPTPAPISQPIPPPQVAANPGSPEAIHDRLKAAEGATGFKLNDIVVTKEGGNYAKVIGFARVNLPGREKGERALVVQYGHDSDGVDVSILLPEDADFVATATH